VNHTLTEIYADEANPTFLSDLEQFFQKWQHEKFFQNI